MTVMKKREWIIDYSVLNDNGEEEDLIITVADCGMIMEAVAKAIVQLGEKLNGNPHVKRWAVWNCGVIADPDEPMLAVDDAQRSAEA